jgi:hypothetical protein
MWRPCCADVIPTNTQLPKVNCTWLTWNCTLSRIQAVCASGCPKANSRMYARLYRDTSTRSCIHTKQCLLPGRPEAKKRILWINPRNDSPWRLVPLLPLVAPCPGDKQILGVVQVSILHWSDSLWRCRGRRWCVLALRPPAPPKCNDNIRDSFHCCCRCHFRCRCRCRLAFPLSRYCLISFPLWTSHFGGVTIILVYRCFAVIPLVSGWFSAKDFLFWWLSRYPAVPWHPVNY